MRIIDRMAGALGFERRATDDRPMQPTTAGHWSSAGIGVNARVVENIAALLACVNAIASVLASLPAFCFRTLPAGRQEDPGHPVARIIRAPNPWQTWPDLIEWTMAQVLLHGNALCVIEYDGAGRPTALIPIPWQNVQPMLLADGRIAFDVVRFLGPWGGVGMPRRYFSTEVFHLKDRSDDGLLGRSRLSRAPEVLGNGLALQEFSGAMWRNQATPSGAFTFPDKIQKEQFDRIRTMIEARHSGAHNGGRVMILEGGAKYEKFSLSPEDAEVLASRRFSVEEMCRLFQVPPPIVQDLSHGTFTNSREAGRWFAQFSLAPWARKIEAEFARSVFLGTTHHLEIDLSGLMRGDFAERWAAHKIAVDAGILDPNEIREAEGYNPREEAPAPAGGGA